MVQATGDRIVGTSAELAQAGVLPPGYKRGKSVARELMEKLELDEEIAAAEKRLQNLRGRAKRSAKRTLASLKKKREDSDKHEELNRKGSERGTNGL